jgi:outer membrane receptor protein involved in Fe transport
MAECPQILKERQLLKIDPLELDFSSKGFVDGILVNYPIIGKVNIAKHYFLCSCEPCEIYRQHTANEGFRLNSLKLLFAREGKQKKVLVPPKTVVKTIQFYFVERLFKGDSVNIEKYLLNKNFLPQGSLQSIITEGLCSINFKGNFDTIRIDFNFDKLDSVTTGASSAIGELSRYSIAPYMGGDWLVADKLSLSGVVRQQFNCTKGEGTNTWPIVERANSSDSGTAYQVAANYRPSQHTRIYGKYDHTFRFPSMDEIAYYSGFGGPPVFFNKNLMPEQSDNIELGGDYSAGFWTLGGAAYHMKTTDEIAYNAVTSLNENLAHTERNGVQAHVLYDRSWIGFRGRADLVNARIMEDPINNSEGRIPMVPRWQTTGTVFARPISGCRVELTHRYIGEASASPATSGIMPSTNFFDAKISYEFSPSWAFYTGVNNLMDKKSMAGNYYGSIYPGEGRFMYLGSTYKF